MAGISLSKHTVTSIGNLITSDGQPTQRRNAYIMDIKNRIKLEAKHIEKQKQGLSMNDRQERSRRGGIVRLSANIES